LWDRDAIVSGGLGVADRQAPGAAEHKYFPFLRPGDVGLLDFLPWYAWALIAALAAVACLALLVPPTAGAIIGLSVKQHIVAVALVEGASAIGIIGIMTYYRTPPEDEDESSEWRFDP